MRNSDPGRNKLFTRRALIFGGLQLGLFGTLAGRLYQLQVIESDLYRMQADDNRINYQLLQPPRGRIVDRFGEVLAVNRQTYRLLLVPEQTPSVELTLGALENLISLSVDEKARILKESERQRSFVPITVRDNLTWAEVSRIEVNIPNLPGAMIDVGESRYYPYGPVTAHLVGYVGRVSERELTGDPLLALPQFRIGKNGVEKFHDVDLRGEAGSRQVEVNAYGRIIRELARKDGTPGNDYMLTVDIGIQQFAASRFGQKSGAAVVLDVHSGDVLVMVSTPGFDPNAFNVGLDQAEWQRLVNHPRAPLTNKATAGQYPPGSIYKMIVALAALEAGLITPEHRIYCPGYVELGNRFFHCWRKQGHGTMRLVDAISHSCDVYFYDIAKRVGVDAIGAMARRFGLGERSGIGLPSEKGGLVPSRDWKMAIYGEPWQKGETLVIGIGQGYLLATPLQLAVMTARLANGGIAVRPNLVRGVVRDGTAQPTARGAAPSMNLSPAALAAVIAGMRAVTNDPTGTAYRARITDPEMAMAGKTGSAQVRGISQAERDSGVIRNKDLPWEQRDHAMFVAFAPVNAPRYAVSVLIEHGGSGAGMAAPIGRDILWETQKRDPSRRVPGTVAGEEI